MQKLIIFCFFLVTADSLFAQADFKTNIGTAKTAYTAGKLEDAHFALQQAMQDLDIIIGKEVLKLMPAKMDTMNVNAKDDHVMANVGFIGATIHRSYGVQNSATVEIISNSPLLGTLNAFLNMPILGGMMRDENTKVVKVQGYKARLEKQNPGSTDKLNYNLQVPFSNALLTFTVNNTNENQVLSLANTLPLQQIAKLIQ